MAAPRQGLDAVQQLTAQTRQALEAFVALCQKHEPVELPLLLDPPPLPENEEDLYFLYYHDGTLAGAASTWWPGREIEVIGAVRPDHRRQGIGRALLDALIQEGRKRGAESLLLVCEEGAPSGIAFARAVGARYESAEYRMRLDRTRYALRPTPPRTLDLRRAGWTDRDTLMELLLTSREVGERAADALIQGWLNDANQRLVVGWHENRALGMIRICEGASSAYLYTFLVHPDLRSHGYGRQILTGVLDALFAEDWPQITLEVDTENVVALSLYRSCGFRPVTTFQYYGLAH